MIPIKIKAIIWDLDGTLIDFKINSLKARRLALKILKDVGVPKEQISINVSILENLKNARNFLEANGFTVNQIEEVVKKVNQKVIEVEHEAALKASMTPGIDKVLEYLKDRNIKQAIFTYNTHFNAELSLKIANIRNYFDIIVGRDDIDNLKPHPDHVRKICELLNLNFNEIIIIGDTNTDIEAALNIGAVCIALDTNIPKFIKRTAFDKADIVIRLTGIPQDLIKALIKFI